MIKNLVLLLSLLSLTIAPSAYSRPQPVSQIQSAAVKVQGTVLDKDGLPVIGAAVMVKGVKSTGTVTDLDGRFELKAVPGASLHISCLGYVDKVLTFDGNPVKVVLEEESTLLEETVVVGYGEQKKESVVGAISQISTEDIINSGTTNITTALTGKLSGVTTIMNGGQPGSNDATILIRGVSSWNGSSPLVMVDGVERSFADIDPNEVATISVLKDASATAVFGAKGANGVIIVTTRTGSVGKAKLNASVTYGMDFPTMLPEHISSATTAEMLNLAFRNAQSYQSQYPQSIIDEYRNPSTRINSIRYPDNDWVDLCLKDMAQSVTANLSISGGTEKLKYFTSFGYSKEGSVFKDFTNWGASNFSYDRFNYRMNLDFTVTPTTLLAVKVGGNLGVQNVPTGTGSVSTTKLYGYMYSSSPMMYPAYYPDWILDEIPDTDYPDLRGDRIASSEGAYHDNIVKLLGYGSYEQTVSNKLYTDLKLKQNLDFITKGLSLTANVSVSTYYSRIAQTATHSNPVFTIKWDVFDANNGDNPWQNNKAVSEEIYEQPAFSVSKGGVENNYYLTFYWEGALNYARDFGDHSVTGLVLFNQREKINTTTFPYRTMGVVSRLTYNYKRKYLLEANLGYTGSEQFSPKNRFGLFPSVAVGYVISQEKWWKSAMPWWSKMKLRYSDGLVGNDQTSSRWLYYSSYSKGEFITEDAAANEVAQWETAHKRDLGIEMGWLKNRLTLNLDLFDEFRNNMLLNPNVTMLVGTKYKEVNKGSMKKHGIDIELGWKDVRKNGFGYNISGMLSLNENRIINFEDAPYAPDYQKTAGKPYKGQTSGVNVVDGGYYTSVDDIHNYPAYTTNWQYVNVGAYKYLDYSADGAITTDDLHAIGGSQYAPLSGSINLGLDYKGFEFRMLWTGSYGKYVEYNKSWEVEFNKGDYRVNKSQLDYWRPDNQDATHSTLVFGGPSGHPMYMWAGGNPDGGYEMMLEGRTWRRADYINLREVYLGYTFKSKQFFKSTGLRSLSVFATGNNLWTITNLLEGDPQSTTFTYGFYPNMLKVKLGVKVGF
ncbi:MAG: TonB-dependent receptor [Candidatus Cryptobacteroides sp.]|nr:TonB-dependent receptor [Candidatus Cryptobacteroides sp.]